MNDKVQIKKLQTMRTLGPTQQTYDAVADKIFGAQPVIAEQPKQSFAQWLLRPQIGFALAFACLVLFFGVIVLNPHVYYNARIALASNAYEKAQFALADAQTGLAKAQSSHQEDASLLAEADIAQQTNDYFNQINLLGEPGKYTKEQCQQLYESYDHYLQAYDHAIEQSQVHADPTTQRELELVQTRLSQYGKQADKRWTK